MTTDPYEAAVEHSPVLKDLWSESNGYKQKYQTNDDVRAILELLRLDNASAFVDVGCGNGAFSIAAARAFPQCQVWAFDPMETAIAECKRKAGDLLNKNLAVATSWAHQTPLTDESMDRALCRAVLHHIAAPEPVYRDICRMLKPGGLLVLQAPCNCFEARYGQILADLMLQLDSSHPRFFYQPAEIIGGLDECGFSVEEPECWTYEFPFLNDQHAEFIRECKADEKLGLYRTIGGKWCIENYWIRMCARKR